MAAKKSNSIKDLLSDGIRQDGLWVVAFVGVCALVATGHIKPETIEYMLFAILGKRSAMPVDDKEKE